nr:uL15 family ribosomal protein [Candidatus Sigynarchaeota archaeon]
MVKFAPDYYGKHGFNRPVCVTIHEKVISIKHLEILLPSWEKSGTATKKGTSHDIDLAQAGFTKLLSTGSVNGKYNITVARASAKAIQKVKDAGGSVTLTAPTGDSE